MKIRVGLFCENFIFSLNNMVEYYWKFSKSFVIRFFLMLNGIKFRTIICFTLYYFLRNHGDFYIGDCPEKI